jgi:hypothetical protein
VRGADPEAEATTSIVEEMPQMYNQEIRGARPSHLAALYGHHGFIRFVVKLGADMKAKSDGEKHFIELQQGEGGLEIKGEGMLSETATPGQESEGITREEEDHPEYVNGSMTRKPYRVWSSSHHPLLLLLTSIIRDMPKRRRTRGDAKFAAELAKNNPREQSALPTNGTTIRLAATETHPRPSIPILEDHRFSIIRVEEQMSTTATLKSVALISKPELIR